MKALLCVALLALGSAACVTSAEDVEVSTDESEARLKCPSGPGVVYYATDAATCANILFSCGTGTPFNNDCGCGCIPGPCERYGCYGTICTDAPPEPTSCYPDDGSGACYDNATCERQPDGLCGWTPTRRLDRCLGSLQVPM
jgi:hypothetical protein